MQTLQQLAAMVDPGFKTAGVRHLAAVLGIVKLPISLRTMLDPVLRELAIFEQSFLPGVWRHIAKDDLLADIKQTIADPLKVKQESTPLCGPTAIVFELVSRHPDRYIRFCRQLWETGVIVALSKNITPSQLLRESADPPLSPADWMLIASLRDDANLIEDIDSDVSELEGFTEPPLWITQILGPSAMEMWTSEILGYDVVNSLSTFISDEIKAIFMASDAWHKGGVAFLLINSSLLHDQEPELIPNHWVAYHGGLPVDTANGTVKFGCYSWGKIFQITMSMDQFSEHMFGVVTGTP